MTAPKVAQSRQATVLALAMTLAPGLASAQPWHLVHSGTTTRYVDTGSVRAIGVTRTYKIRVLWYDNQLSYEREAVSDCEHRRQSELNPTENNILRWQTVIDGTGIEAELTYVCTLPLAQPPAPPDPQPMPTPAPVPNPPQSVQPGKPLELSPPRERLTGTGTGFLLAGSHVITNDHVVVGCDRIEVLSAAMPAVSVSIRSRDSRLDLALLSLPSRVGLPSPPIRSRAQLGEEIMISGFPLSGVLSTDVIVVSGLVNSLAGLRNDPTLLQISAPVQPGNSGGPVLDRTGAVVGVVVSKLNAKRIAELTGDIAQNVNFAIKPELLRLFLDANQVPYSTEQPRKALSTVEIAAAARAFTVQITQQSET